MKTAPHARRSRRHRQSPVLRPPRARRPARPRDLHRPDRDRRHRPPHTATRRRGLLDGLADGLTVADPRIWPLKIVAPRRLVRRHAGGLRRGPAHHDGHVHQPPHHRRRRRAPGCDCACSSTGSPGRGRGSHLPRTRHDDEASRRIRRPVPCPRTSACGAFAFMSGDGARPAPVLARAGRALRLPAP